MAPLHGETKRRRKIASWESEHFMAFGKIQVSLDEWHICGLVGFGIFGDNTPVSLALGDSSGNMTGSGSSDDMASWLFFKSHHVSSQ